jgi:hypothetical protein
VLGKPVFARAQLSGTQGTVRQVQFYDPVPGRPSQVIGVAQDNHGNICQLTL